MSKSKQEPIFSKLKDVEAGFPLREERAEGTVERSSTASIIPEIPLEISRLEAETVQTEHTPVISSREPGRVDPLDALEASFVFIPPGRFTMGSTEYETGRNPDETPHEVTLTKGFYIQKTPVTREQWKAVMGDSAAFSDGPPNCPVESVSWNECQEFIRRLNEKTKSRRRLPTEAEWEYACRAGSSAPFCNGELTEPYCAQDAVLCEVAWYCANSGRKIHPAAEKSPNGWGLHDMHGNVNEWCQDWYGEYSPEPQTDPVGPGSGLGKVIRGGSWFSNAKNCRSASRFHWPPNSRSDAIGFRLVRNE